MTAHDTHPPMPTTASVRSPRSSPESASPMSPTFTDFKSAGRFLKSFNPYALSWSPRLPRLEFRRVVARSEWGLLAPRRVGLDAVDALAALAMETRGRATLPRTGRAAPNTGAVVANIVRDDVRCGTPKRETSRRSADAFPKLF